MALISDDVLRSYDDVRGLDPFSGRRSDHSATNFHENRMRRPLVSVFELQDEYPKEEIVSVVDKCMKKYVDKLLLHIERISGRLSQLEIHCYKLERSIGEFRADTLRDQSEVDVKFKSLAKNVEKVQRSIQILRDKQELAETDGELTKLKLTPKESDTSTQSHKCEETIALSLVYEPKQYDNIPGIPNPHSAPALPSHGHYFLHQPAPIYPQQSQALQSEIHYIQVQPRLQIQDPSIQSPSPSPQQPQVVIHNHPPLPFPQYPLQFAQQAVPAMHQLPPQPPIVRPQIPPTYTLYPHQPTNQETFAYGASGSPVKVPSQPKQQASRQSFVSAAPYQPQSHLPLYTAVYSIDGNTVQSAQTHQHLSSSGELHYLGTKPLIHLNHSPNMMQDHGDVIEKAVSMGYPREEVVVAVNRMAENGKAVDFSAVLDRMNSRPQAWSG